VGNPVEGLNLTYYDEEEVALIVPTTNNSLFAIDPGTYKLGNKEFEFNMGGVYTIVISLDGKDIGVRFRNCCNRKNDNLDSTDLCFF
jgi:hypothetical protein